jgi:hypothetical protein
MTERPRRFDGDGTDAAIDRAVREIMNRDAAPGFRRRVVARLEREPRIAWTWGQFGLIATAAAVVLLLAVWARTPQPLQQPVSEPRRAELVRPVVEPAPTPTRPATTPAAPSDVKREARAVAERRTQTPTSDRRVTAASIDPAEERLERGTANPRVPDGRVETTRRPSGDPLSIPPLQIRPLETGEIRMKSMTVGPLVVVPLLPPR